MKAKTSFMLCVSALALILLAGVASAGVLTLSPLSIPSSVDDDSGSFTGTYNITYNGTLDNITVSFSGTANFGSVSIPSTGLNQNESKTVTATFTLPSGHGGETMNGTVNASGSGGSSDIASFSVTVTETSSEYDFCSVEFGELDENVSNEGELSVSIKDIQNNGMGKDDEWYPSDEIEVDVKVENEGNDDIDDIVVEWGLWSEETDEWVIEIDEEDEFNLKEDKDETITFTIDLYDDLDVDLEDLEDGDYILYARAIGTVDDDDDTETCEFDTENINIIVDSDLVVLNDIKVTGTPFCGSTIQITADILNIGSDDQEGVYINIHSTELGINEDAEVGDIDAYEDQVLDFEFTIPSNLAEKEYSLTIDVYDEDDDLYESSDDDKSRYYVDLDVSGNCVRALNANVYASLESGGKAGGEMKIKASVTNNADSQQTFTVSVADYSDWAELVEIEPEEVTLNAGASRDVIITLNVDSDAEEDQTLNVVLTSDDGESTSQPLAVTIERGFSLSGMFGDNAYLWGIALVNIVLIVVIVVVAVKATRR